MISDALTHHRSIMFAPFVEGSLAISQA
jgi:hypothetical protein